MGIKKIILSTIVAVLGAGMIVFFVLVAFFYFTFPRETHSLWKYKGLRAQWGPQLVSHFPPEIPADASLKKFSHFPAVLQGGASIQLRLSLPPERFRELYSQFSAQKTKSFLGGDTNRHMNEPEGMPTTFFYTSGNKDGSFPDDFEIMIFDKVLPEAERPPGFYWNHGQSHGVAMSMNRNEIVYWAENW